MIIWDLLGVIYNGEINSQAKEIIQKLKDQGIKNSCISNMPSEVVERFAKELDLSPVLVSQDLGMSKNGPEIYKYFLEQTDLKPDQCLFIDDHLINIIAAKTVGMKTVLFSKKTMVPTPQADYIIDDISKLSNLISKLTTFN